jgi:hypothetical protein
MTSQDTSNQSAAPEQMQDTKFTITADREGILISLEGKMTYTALLVSLGDILKKPISKFIGFTLTAAATWCSQTSNLNPSRLPQKTLAQPNPIVAPIIQTPSCIAHPQDH